MNGTNLNSVSELKEGHWTKGALPSNVRAGIGTIITDDLAFKRFHSRADIALSVGTHCTMDGVHFDLSECSQVEIGDYCYFTSVVLLCERKIKIGSYVVIGWNTTIADSDFHPISPAARIADAIACSPLGTGRRRPEICPQEIIIENDVWIGPNVTILKGTHIGEGAFVEAGSLVTRDIPPYSRVMGNPAVAIGKMS